MFPYTFETVTAITLTVIGIILALYFIVLKRKGWLREDSHESFYLGMQKNLREAHHVDRFVGKATKRTQSLPSLWI